ncbi:DUF305 domain-containing protein [Massilia sp. H6]|uniref:DUF305 domain-containing protein n=1 Tax=Massilia sp. H6 TaxID=2970464 RepID=UPI0021683080|nr:DUF305 domain-containing protein [Massilia sp. H6]UVW30505.1 DUF305 domain-containing protein [Massilia sp. H6]
MKNVQARIALVAGAVALAFGAAGSAFAQSGQHGQHAQHGTAAATTSQPGNMSHQEMMKTMQDMHQKMSTMSMTGDHDHDFAMMMRSHHQAGIDMAKAQLKNGKDPQMQQMAKKIIADQTKEIQKLDQWMAKHHPSNK